ncbi:cyclin-D5-1 isoform X2 [Jatropha curcas]|uniref:cyclin-D5-1 isoform X2 n=1 Tax=Jatropha curcas TaxID=180498 RepID=UPI0005FADFD4|nr:cyclin-D5-1 isoform X2 [Jatropha curcas]
MDDFDASSLSFSSLLCLENEVSCFDQMEEEVEEDSFYDANNNFESCLVLESEDIEYIEKMFEKEMGLLGSANSYVMPSADSLSTTTNDSNWLRFARLDAIDWIFNTRALFGFRFHTAYLSVTYLDRFLSKRSIDDGKLWAIRLLSVACLSLAAKMEECRVPSLSEFPMEDYCFENKVIQRMELLVLNTLEWKMGSITPFSYLNYFISKICGESRPKETISRAVELILAVIKEINLLEHRPSVIAVAAVLAASDNQLTRQELDVKVKLISSTNFLENEIEMGKLKTPKQAFSPNSINSCFTTSSGTGSKRRLTYNDCDQNCPVKKICQ